MNMNKFNNDARLLLSHYGSRKQIEKAIEECYECAEALQEHLEYSDKRHAIEEVADCTLMMLQMSILFGAADVEEMIERKIKRQNERISREPQNRNMR